MMLLFGTIDAVASELLGGMRMKYSIAICDDSKTDAALVQSFLLEWAKQRGTEVEIEVFPSAESISFFVTTSIKLSISCFLMLK